MHYRVAALTQPRSSPCTTPESASSKPLTHACPRIWFWGLQHNCDDKSIIKVFLLIYLCVRWHWDQGHDVNQAIILAFDWLANVSLEIVVRCKRQAIKICLFSGKCMFTLKPSSSWTMNVLIGLLVLLIFPATTFFFDK